MDSGDIGWLGNAGTCEELGNAGRWNINHVGEDYDPAFLDTFEEAVRRTEPA